MTAYPKPAITRLKGKRRSELRREVCELHGARCSVCGRHAPLLDRDGVFDVFTCGHMSHVKSTGSGGDDTVENITWKCFKCHCVFEHGPKWSKNDKI